MTIALLLVLSVAVIMSLALMRAAALKPQLVPATENDTEVSDEISYVLRFESRLTAAQVTRRLRKRGWAIGRAAVRSILNEVASATRTKRGRLLYS